MSEACREVHRGGLDPATGGPGPSTPTQSACLMSCWRRLASTSRHDRGLNIAVGEPLFVTRLDPERREVIVGPREALLTGSLTLEETNWLGDAATLPDAARDGAAVLARVRSTRQPSPARLRLDGEAVQVVFDRGEEGVAPGQACALYDPADPDRVLGGGFIQSTAAVA